MSVGIKLRK